MDCRILLGSLFSLVHPEVFDSAILLIILCTANPSGLTNSVNDMVGANFKNMDAKIKPVKPVIKYEDLAKLDIRVGTIELVENIDNSEKLVKLTVNFGDHKRKILVGMKKERENPKEVEGKQALFVVNLEPKEMLGEISEGMILDIGYDNGIIPVLAEPEKPVPDGVNAG